VVETADVTEARDRTHVSQNVWWHGRNTGSEKWSRQMLHFNSSASYVQCGVHATVVSDRFLVVFRSEKKKKKKKAVATQKFGCAETQQRFAILVYL
jgi:hypothetical protein